MPLSLYLAVRLLNCSLCVVTVAYASTIHGLVSDSNGKPLVKAQVELVQPFKAGNPITAKTSTDAAGYYEFTEVNPGRYQLFASKAAEGYGDPLGSFFAAGRPDAPDITLKDGSEVLSINIDVGQPGGFLTGRIVDQNSQEPLPQARIKLLLAADESKFVSFGPDEKGKFNTVVPAMPIRVLVSAPGYRSQESFVSVTSKEHKELLFRIATTATNK